MLKPFHFLNRTQWLLALFVSLCSPIIHLIRWLLSPDEYNYYFFLNQDLADWHYILKSADNQFLSIHDIESDVPIWLRPDCHFLLFSPFILIGKWLSLSSSFLLLTVDVLGNFFCALATFYFFQTLLNDERKSVLAFCLVYFSSGIVGIIVLLRCLWIGDFAQAVSGWVGENHSLGYDLMEGNMVHWTTILFRPYYLFPRAFGLIAIALLYRAYDVPNQTKLIISFLFLFLATLIHPQSGLIYGAMAGLLLLLHTLRYDNVTLFKRVKPALWTISGVVFAAILWKLYQRIPEVDAAAKEYLKRMYNADSLPLFFAIATILLPIILWTLIRTQQKLFALLLLFAVLLYSGAVSEWFIRSESVSIRILLLAVAFSMALITLVWKRKYLLNLLRSQKPSVYLGLCALTIGIIALSPHHDGIKILSKYESLFGALTPIIQSLLQILALIYAAPFRLGLAVPLAGILATLISEFSPTLRKLVLSTVFGVSAISISLYLFLLFSGNSGYLHTQEADAMRFLKTLHGKNVLCSTHSSQFIIQIAQKRTLIGGIAGVLNLNERQHDLSTFFTTEQDTLRRQLLKKYAMDYIYIGQAERQLIQDTTFYSSWTVIFENASAKILQAAY